MGNLQDVKAALAAYGDAVEAFSTAQDSALAAMESLASATSAANAADGELVKADGVAEAALIELLNASNDVGITLPNIETDPEPVMPV